MITWGPETGEPAQVCQACQRAYPPALLTSYFNGVTIQRLCGICRVAVGNQAQGVDGQTFLDPALERLRLAAIEWRHTRQGRT